MKTKFDTGEEVLVHRRSGNGEEWQLILKQKGESDG